MGWTTATAFVVAVIIGCGSGLSPIESANYNEEERKVSR